MVQRRPKSKAIIRDLALDVINSNIGLTSDQDQDFVLVIKHLFLFHPGRHACAINQFSCVSSGKCIPAAWRCDNDNDCKDGSDELNCEDTKAKCDEEQFQCLNKNCIEKVFRCNGHDNCGDNSDEENCPSCRPGFVSYK